jgi:beta-galactosidase
VMASEKNGIRFDDGEVFEATLLCDRIRLETAETVATYTSDFYAGEPAVTKNAFGQGNAYYVATQPEATGIRRIVATLCRELGISSPLADGVAPPAGVEVTQRGEFVYLLNHGEPVSVALAAGSWMDLLTGETLTGSASLELRGVRVLKKS